MTDQECCTGVRSELLESNSISTKLPQYFEVPIIWFDQIEAIFGTFSIKKEYTKFSHLLANLWSYVLVEFQEFVTRTFTAVYVITCHYL